MITELKCLTLIIAMEARNQSEKTQALVGSVAIYRAKQESLTICKSMKTAASYSWMWDGVNTVVSKEVLASIEPIATKELEHPSITGRYFFNNCELGKRFETKYKLLRSGDLCFY